MKPSNWTKLPKEERKRIGMELFHSMRGQYIIGQALAWAAKAMSQVPPPMTEVSNIQDMEIFMETVFPPIGVDLDDVEMTVRRKMGKEEKK